MADRHRRHPDVCLEYAFDRLLASKLKQAYDILVPDQVRSRGTADGMTNGESHEDRCHLRTRVLQRAT